MIEFFYDLCYMLPVNLVFSLCFLTYTDRAEHGVLGCVAGSLLIIAVAVLCHVGNKLRFLIIGAILVAMGGLYWVLGPEKRSFLFENYGFLLFIFGIATVCILVGRMAGEQLWVKLIVTAALMGNDVYLMIERPDASRVIVAASFLVIMVYAVSLVQLHWKKSGYTDIKQHISLITPVLLIVFLLVCIMPSSEKPYDWQLAKTIWNRIVTEYNRVSGYLSAKQDEYGYSGFSEEGTFNSELKISNKEALVISSDNAMTDCLYLGGIHFTDFTGNKWEPVSAKEDNYRRFDLLETKAVISKYVQGSERNYIRENTIKIESRIRNTRHLFLPAKVNLDHNRTVLPDFKEDSGSALTKAKLRFGDSYAMSYHRINYANPEMESLIDGAEPLSEEEWNKVLKDVAASSDDTCSYNNYLKYKDRIKTEYGKTVGLSAELRTVIDGITEGVEGDYEKIKALALFLQTMDYNTNPGAIPGKVTGPSGYLDYFMLESKSGYCIHYATSLVLLARELGYPARYVQGYILAMTGDTQNFTVTEANAHAWAEVYFENFGWVVFEATPGYSAMAGWRVESLADIPTSQDNFTNNDDNKAPKEDINEDIGVEPEKKAFPIRYILIPVVLVTFFGTMYLMVNRVITNVRYKKMEINEKALFLVQCNLRILRLMGYPILSNETVAEYRERIIEECLFSRNMMDFLNLYERMLYSDYSADAEDMDIIEYGHDELILRLRGYRIKQLFYVI